MSKTGLVVRRVAIDSIHPDPANARLHGPENLDAIIGSLKRFGQAEPLIIQKATGRIIGGHGRLTAMKKLGWTECDIVELDIDDLQATALGIALNRTGELAAWDQDALVKILAELRDQDSLDGTGYRVGDIDELLAQLNDEQPREVDDPGPEEPPTNPVSRAGDLWTLDQHNLLCADSTKADDVMRLMGDEKAKMVATDPPFLVDFTGERPNNSGKDWTRDYREIDIKDAEGFFRSVFTNILRVIAPHTAIYCWHAHKRQGLISRIWEELGILDHQQIIWVKPTPVFGRAFWHFRHEPAMMGWVQGSKPDHDGKHDHDSVWECDWAGKARVVGNEHPMQKPVELFARPMRKHTKPGDICFEPFSGSGSQLIAAEQLGRRCRAIEISPAFVDVAVKRWQTAAGKLATLAPTGQTFADVTAQRSC